MRRLSPGQQEALRMRVVAALREGMTGAEAVRVFGVSEGSIRNWKARYAFGGAEGLESRRSGRKAGEARKLTPDQEKALVEAIIEFEPEQLDLDGKLWTRRKVTELAYRLFRVRYTERGMGKLLQRMGLSFQRPDRRAVEANPEAMAEWVESTYPALVTRTEAEGAVILFADQVGVRPDHLSGATWGRVGQTPTVARTGKRFSLNAMSVISPRGDLRFTVFEGRFDTAEFLTFCKRLVSGYDTKIHLVLDGHPVHRSKATKAWMGAHREQIELHYLPAYAPHLNPDELVNPDLKRTLADKDIRSRDQMEVAVRSFFRRVQKLPGHVRGYFQGRYTEYASTV
ncbi:IS630 family transposase [Nocardia mangyaensis]|uniref:IS630 family transposase n=1 Tax=Nocardia mangyaensis TaxID=2213200 RepID=UPI0026764DDB|nr:IS630 family transposase [Nocardia mangyaensis]